MEYLIDDRLGCPLLSITTQFSANNEEGNEKGRRGEASDFRSGGGLSRMLQPVNLSLSLSRLSFLLIVEPLRENFPIAKSIDWRHPVYCLSRPSTLCALSANQPNMTPPTDTWNCPWRRSPSGSCMLGLASQQIPWAQVILLQCAMQRTRLRACMWPSRAY